jgi:DNA (cytosine-5)-methyltransferase 3A
MLKEEGFEFDGQSYLFWEYVRVWKAIQPKYFFLENVRVTKKWLPMFNEAMGVEPIMINSSLMSAQNRVRFYWTNIPGLEQPQDKGILLRDVLETDIDTSKYKVKPSVLKNIERDHNEIIKSNKDFFTMKTTSGFQDNKVGLRKTPCLRAGNSATYILQVKEATKKGYTEIQDGDCFDYSVPNSKTRRGRNMKDKSNCLQTSNGFMRYEHPTYRKLTPLECERLQTVPDNYTEGVSNSQRYKMLGNGWTVDVIAHIFKGIRDD